MDTDINKTVILGLTDNPTNTFLRTAKNEETFKNLPIRRAKYPVQTIPENFSGRQQWGPLIPPVANQGKCGSCYAWAATAALASRFNIFSRADIAVNLSAAKILLCDLGGEEYDLEPDTQTREDILNIQQQTSQTMVCHGNTLVDTWRYLFVIGTCTEICFPYELNSHLEGPSLGEISNYTESIPLCTQFAGPYAELCIDKSPQRTYRAIQYYTVQSDVQSLQRELWTNGPFSTAMRVYANFYEFDPTTQVYEYNQLGKQLGGHAVVITGWGTSETDGDFWWVRNSFGQSWGIKGYFKMRRGTDECGLESNVVVGLPDFFMGLDKGMELFDIDPKKDIIAADLGFRDLYENSNMSGGGFDPLTGYIRYYYEMWPELQKPFQPLTMLSPLIAANITWSKILWDLGIQVDRYQIQTSGSPDMYVMVVGVCVTLLIIFVLILLSYKMIKS